MNSPACKKEKHSPSRTVIPILIQASILFEHIVDICAQVMEAPLESSTTVLSKGTANGSMCLIPAGGQTDPRSVLGLNEEWKKDQKNDMKKNASLIMNNNIPQRSPYSTLIVCFPCIVASRLISRHHCLTVISNKMYPRNVSLSSNLCI